MYLNFSGTLHTRVTVLRRITGMWYNNNLLHPQSYSDIEPENVDLGSACSCVVGDPVAVDMATK